jgi:hypothetical protein
MRKKQFQHRESLWLKGDYLRRLESKQLRIALRRRKERRNENTTKCLQAS